MPDIVEGYITVPEAARGLKRSTEQIRRYLREGRLEGQRIGKQWFIKEPAVLSGAKPGKGTDTSTQEYAPLPGLGHSSMADDSRLALFGRINNRREQIRTQWKQLNVNLNAGTVVRDLRDDES
jgi:excisionase family DNA binding protein